MVIREIATPIWDLGPSFQKRIGRAETTVEDYLRQQGIVWLRGEGLADLDLFKEMTGECTGRLLGYHLRRRLLPRRPYVSMIGEPRELAPCAYRFADPTRTLAVAPGDNFERLFFANEWLDPCLEDWRNRPDRICWIGRPIAERIDLAREMLAVGLPLDIYSREPWPLPAWKGYAPSEVEVSRHYRYRIVCENSTHYGYHSEKLFGSVRSGCVTFYLGDQSLHFRHIEKLSLPLTIANLLERHSLSDAVLTGIGEFMFSDEWEIYSFKSFFDRLIAKCHKVLSA